MQRREFAKHGLAGIAGLGAGYTLVEHSTGQASASVSMGDFSIDDASKTTDDGTIEDVVIDLKGNWEYKLPSGKNPHRWRVTINVTDGESVEKINETYGPAKYLTNSGNYALYGSVTESSLYSAQDFAAPEGKIKTVTIGVVVFFDVLNQNGDVLATSQLEDTADVKVTNEGYQPDEHGSASGTGEVVIKT